MRKARHNYFLLYPPYWKSDSASKWLVNSSESFLIFGQRMVNTLTRTVPYWCSTAPLTGNEALMSRVCQFLWYKHFHHDQRQATNGRPVASQNTCKFNNWPVLLRMSWLQPTTWTLETARTCK